MLIQSICSILLEGTSCYLANMNTIAWLVSLGSNTKNCYTHNTGKKITLIILHHNRSLNVVLKTALLLSTERVT